MGLELPVLEQTRLEQCQGCDHYVEQDNACNWLRIHTGKQGRLSHPRGIGNPRSRCPNYHDRRWLEIPSYHAWFIGEAYLRINDNQRYRLTQTGVGYYKPIGLVNLIYEFYNEYNIPDSDRILRSSLITELEFLSRRPNTYDFITSHNLEISYITGDLKPVAKGQAAHNDSKPSPIAKGSTL